MVFFFYVVFRWSLPSSPFRSIPTDLMVLSNGNVVVGVSGQDQVRIYNDEDDFV
jgi:hypothetical protein